MNIDGRLRIERIIGNNVILAKEESTDTELVLFGKGIGFYSKDIGYLQSNDPRIEKRFRMDDQDRMKDYRLLLDDIPTEVVRISEKIIELVASRFEKTIRYKIYFALPSHIHFAIYRLRNGMDIVNPFLYETKMVFPKEYDIACEAAEMIREAFHVDIPEDEIGFLSYHIHSGIADVSVGQIIKFSNLINQLVIEIEQRENIRIPRESAAYSHLISHFRYMIERILQRKVTPNPFLPEMKNNSMREYALAVELRHLIQDQLQTDMPDEEVGYLVMHLFLLFQSISTSQE
ncbi:PRD domain-containing protein [Paenibacillus sp. 2TAB23]|uniref:PRD domain-containing protein n=1 Tax=Paenibacillus sp. 2TAB23 TaxID=3233004 RepID=UPI003F9BD62E